MLQKFSSKKVKSKKDLSVLKNELSKKFCLNGFPSNSSLLSMIDSKDNELLKRKPVRSLSGITVVSVMIAPFDCPGKCSYCPNGIFGVLTPKSYTGFEPSAMKALRVDFDSFKQVSNRINQLKLIGHSPSKIELIIMGGTFLSTPIDYQYSFVKGCYDAINQCDSINLEQAKKINETALTRIIGLTIETRPDYSGKAEIDRILDFGSTRVELGVQTIYDDVLQKNNRGNSIRDVVNSTALLKDSGFKVCYHLMPGLPGSSEELDVNCFKEVFSNPDFQPDMLKIYPCLVIPGTKLHEDWKKGEFTPLSSEQAARIIAKAKRFVPKHVRIMRVQRDIPANLIASGAKASNLRQLVEKELEKENFECNCIRCREIGIVLRKKKIETGKEPKLCRTDYEASDGLEIFLSIEFEKENSLIGFCRLRIPSNPFRKELLGKTALIRELHVYGNAIEIGKTDSSAFQHKGIGKKLLAEAERISLEEFNCNKIAVISGVGAREYYKKQGYELEGLFMAKKLLTT